jgi:hypothetical protein
MYQNFVLSNGWDGLMETSHRQKTPSASVFHFQAAPLLLLSTDIVKANL